MSTRFPRAARLALVAALLLAFSTKPTFDYTDTTWNFGTAKLSIGAGAKKIGHVKHSEVDVGQVVLNADGSWTLVYQSTGVAGGTWSVTDAFSKTIDLALDPSGQQQLFDFVQTSIENLAAQKGVSVNTTLDTVKVEKIRLLVKPKIKPATATVKLVATCTLTGLTDRTHINNAPTICKVKLTGTSDVVPLSTILP